MQRFEYDATAVIAEHSQGFGEAVTGRLDLPVVSCPGWTVRDLVKHVIDVHWFWASIVDERLSAPPDESRRPAPPGDDDDLLAVFGAGADRLVAVLAAADPTMSVWTWAPAQQNAGFVIRHQVQEMLVHHWDAAAAVEAAIAIEPFAAADSVDEFLAFSVSSDDDPADPPRPALGGEFGLRCPDAAACWRITGGDVPGTVHASLLNEPDSWRGPTVEAPAADMLLWLYRRIDLDTGDVDDALLDRFRALTFTD